MNDALAVGPSNVPPASAAGSFQPQSSTIGTPFRGSPARVIERRYVRPVKPETNFRRRGVIQLGLMLLSFLCLFVSVFLDIGSIKSSSWPNDVEFTGSMSLWSACLTFDQCDGSVSGCSNEQQCLDPAWLTCTSSADIIYAARIIIILAVISFVPGLIVAGFDALGKSPARILCLSDRVFFVLLGVLRAVLIATSGALATATWTGEICGQRLLNISGTTISGLPYTALAAFIINFIVIIVGGCAPQPADQREEQAARRKAKKARQAAAGQGNGGEEEEEMARINPEQPPVGAAGGPGTAPQPTLRASTIRSALPPPSASSQLRSGGTGDEEDAEVAATLGATRPLAGSEAVVSNR